MSADKFNTLDRAVRHLVSLQRESGCWEGEMVWCTMILSQYVIVQRIAGRSFDERQREQIVKHYRVTRTSEGAWGLHPESGGYVFTTTLAYIALRLAGVSAEDPMLSTARQWLRKQEGGVLAIPTWGKFWLAVLGLYAYEGMNPVPPEMFLLPKWLPFHPHHYYCHTRLIYMALSFVYGSRYRAQLGGIVLDLRKELFDQPFESIDFAAHRHDVASTDLYVRPAPWLRFAAGAMSLYERMAFHPLRRRALNWCFERIVVEQKTTRYQALSPVNGLLNCMAFLARNPNHPELAPSLDGLEKWKWEDESEGIRYAGARSHTWDTAFAMLALMDSPAVAAQCADVLERGYRYLCDAQMIEEIQGYREQDRDAALGGWCFSDGRHRWPVSDCTAEALSALLKFHERFPQSRTERISDARIHLATEFILSRQNADGGFGTYERRRGPAWLESVNPSEMFGQCMTERSYIECTASAVGALAHVRDAYPDLIAEKVTASIERGIRFLRTCQRPDGSFPGFWGVNFTYAIFHVVKGLRAAGVPVSDALLVRTGEWLVSKQRPDGGWGEHYSGCLEDRYVEHSESQVVMTSWALLALIDLLGSDAQSVARGIAWLQSMQIPDGAWPSQAVNGVFFGAAMLDYRLYKAYFPVWALARYQTGSHSPPAP